MIAKRSLEPGEEQTAVAPACGAGVRSDCMRRPCETFTYRAVKLRSLATATLDNIVDADISTCQRLFARATGACDRSVIAIAVAVNVPMGFSETTVRAVTTALCRWSHAPSMRTGRLGPSATARLRGLRPVCVARLCASAHLVVDDGWQHLECFVQMWTRSTRRHCGLTRIRRVVFCVWILC